jgi:hypothetical protein
MKRLLSGAMAVLGIWVLVTPWITDFTTVNWASWVCGAIILILAGWGAYSGEA